MKFSIISHVIQRLTRNHQSNFRHILSFCSSSRSGGSKYIMQISLQSHVVISTLCKFHYRAEVFHFFPMKYMYCHSKQPSLSSQHNNYLHSYIDCYSITTCTVKEETPSCALGMDYRCLIVQSLLPNTVITEKKLLQKCPVIFFSILTLVIFRMHSKCFPMSCYDSYF